MFCTKCGAELQSNAKFCAQCGMAISGNQLKLDIKEELIENKTLIKEESSNKVQSSVNESPKASLLQENGVKQMKSGNNQEALADFKQLINLYPNHPYIYETFLNIGICQLRLKNYDSSKLAIQKAIDINPNYKEAYTYQKIVNNRTSWFNQPENKVWLVPAGIIGAVLLRLIARVLF